MRAVGLHPDVVVVTSRFWQTTCTLVRSGEEAFCIDSPVLPDELEILPSIAEQARFRVVGLMVTHADWDHVLGRYAFPDAPLGVGESTAQRLRDRAGPRAARAARLRRGELHRAPRAARAAGAAGAAGARGTARSATRSSSCTRPTATPPTAWRSGSRGRSVLVCGDYLSPVEIPMLSPGGSREAYLATLDRLEPLVEQAAHVVPGHGEVLDAPRAAAILREDRAYLEGLPDAPLPLARRTGAQKRIHAENVEAVAS